MDKRSYAKGDRIIWQFGENTVPVISRVLRVGFQGIWVKFGDTTVYLNPDMVLAYRPVTKRRKQVASVRSIR